MSKRVLFTLIFTLSFLQFFSTTYYVAPSTSGGSDSNAGTLAAPFETLQYAVNRLSAGDILYIRAGTYRETITIDEDGASGNLITIENYNNEVVTIDGTVDVTGTWSTYGSVPGAYQLSSYSADITQLFVDDEPMVMRDGQMHNSMTILYFRIPHGRREMRVMILTQTVWRAPFKLMRMYLILDL